MFKSAGQSSVDCPALLFSVYFHLVFIPINLFSPCVPSPMSILICPVTCYSLASRSFWTFLLLFSALCPFSPARFRISLWLPENFGLIYCFSVLYVHFLLPDSVFLSGFRRILDFFPVFLGFMSIFSCLVPCYSLASCSFWPFLLLFCALCPFFPARFSVSLCLHVHFGLFSCFSRLYIHMEEYRSLKTAKSSEGSGLRRVRRAPDFEEFGSLKTAMCSESPGLRKSALRRIKRPAIICPAREIHKSE